MKVACTTIVAVPRFRAAMPTASRAATSEEQLDILLPTERSAGTMLRQNAVDHMASHVGQAEVAPLVAVCEPLVVDPQ